MTDAFNLWFSAAEELGEYIGIRFGRLAPLTATPEWFFLPHSEYDGIGGLAELLRRRDAQLDSLMQLKHPHPDSWLPFFRAVPRYLKPRKRLEWAFSHSGPRISNDDTLRPTAVAWHVFEESATTQIRRVCRKAGVTVNSFLLKHLTKAIRPYLKDQSSVVPWVVPVNLRGKLVQDRDTKNHSSCIGVKVKSYETVHDVHRNIYEALGHGEHWANWYSYKLAFLTTSGMRRFLITKGLAVPELYLGSFSNLGDWDPEKKITSPQCQGAWLFCPPVLRFQCVGAGCVTFQNRLSLVIQAHPELLTDSTVTQAWMTGWVKEIQIDISSVLDETAVIPMVAA
jgi:NRPS condensation-like uncharacterized protein